MNTKLLEVAHKPCLQETEQVTTANVFVAHNSESLSEDVVSLVLLLLLLVIESPPEEHDVWLRTMNGVMDPSTALLHSNRTPLVLQKKPHNTFVHQRDANKNVYIISSSLGSSTK